MYGSRDCRHEGGPVASRISQIDSRVACPSVPAAWTMVQMWAGSGRMAAARGVGLRRASAVEVVEVKA